MDQRPRDRFLALPGDPNQLAKLIVDMATREIARDPEPIRSPMRPRLGVRAA